LSRRDAWPWWRDIWQNSCSTFPLRQTFFEIRQGAHTMIPRERLTATLDGEFVVFLIGMRINSLWKVHQWLPITRAMPRMLAELAAHPELGMLGGEMWFGRTTILVQYWRTMDQLFDFATRRDSEHLPVWRQFNQSIAASGDVGVWHETYSVSPGTYENIYVNMPPFGLGKVGKLVPASAALTSAAGRVQASGTPAA